MEKLITIRIKKLYFITYESILKAINASL